MLEAPGGPAAAAWKDEAFAAFAEYHAHASAHPMCMLRRGRFKLNCVLDEPAELYDLQTDPGETRDLAGDPTYAGVVAGMTRRVLAGWPARQRARDLIAAAWRRGT